MKGRYRIRGSLRTLRAAMADRRGVTILEYGLILAAASLIILALAEILGNSSIDNFIAIENSVSEAGGQD